MLDILTLWEHAVGDLSTRYLRQHERHWSSAAVDTVRLQWQRGEMPMFAIWSQIDYV